MTSADDGAEVPDDVIVKGYEVTKGNYVVVDPDELEQFMPVHPHDRPRRVRRPRPRSTRSSTTAPTTSRPTRSPKPYALLARAMEEAGKVGIGRFVMRNKQYMAAMRPVDGRLVLSTMVYADEIVGPTKIDELETLDDVEISDKELDMAEQLVDSLTGTFEPERYHDNYREQVLDLIERKAAGETIEVPARRRRRHPQVVDLMAALEASVKAAKSARGPPSRPPDEPEARSGARKAAKAAPQAQDARDARSEVGSSDSALALQPRKVLYPETGFTKAEVIDYYPRIAPAMLPHLARPGADLGASRTASTAGLLREAMPEAPARLGADGPRSRRPRRPDRVLRVRRAAALVWAANMAALELHAPMALAARPRGARRGRVRPRPRRAGRRSSSAPQVALLIRDVLGSLDLEAFAEDVGIQGSAALRAGEHADAPTTCRRLRAGGRPGDGAAPTRRGGSR